MAVTANQLISRAEGCKKGYPIAASTHLYQGTLSFVNASGYLDDDTASGVNAFAGVNIEEKDNSAGVDAALSTEVWRDGEFLLTGSGFTQASVGVPIYATDNYTITATKTTSGAVRIGVCTEYVSTTKVWVRIDPIGSETLAADSLNTNVIVFDGATGVNEIRVPTNLADALSIESSAGDILAVDTTTGTVVITVGAAVRLNVAGDAQIGSATTDLVAFHGSTPTDQCAAYTQTFSTADRTHATPTVGADLGAFTDPPSAAEMAALRTFVNALKADHADLAQLANAIIDDLQEKGLCG